MTKKEYSDMTPQEKYDRMRKEHEIYLSEKEEHIRIGRELREGLEKERYEEMMDELLHPKTFIDRLLELTKFLLIGFVVFSVLFTIITIFF